MNNIVNELFVLISKCEYLERLYRKELAVVLSEIFNIWIPECISAVLNIRNTFQAYCEAVCHKAIIYYI